MREKTTRLSQSNQVHPTAWIEEGSLIGEFNYFGPFTYIAAGITIGDNNRFEGHCSIGTPPEHKEKHLAVPPYNGHGVRIGNHCVFKEFTTVNQGVLIPTQIGNRVWMLRGSHAGHDAVIEDDVTISCNVMVGGHSVVMRGANIGLGAVIHQKRVIGALCMVGMNSTVTKNVPPFLTAFGSPCRPHHLNDRGLVAAGYSKSDRDQLLAYEEDILESGGFEDFGIESPFYDEIQRYLKWVV